MATKPADALPLRRDDAERVRVPLYPLTWQIIGAATLVLGAGVLHFVYAPMHLAAARGQGLFFLLLGFAQVGWGALVLRHPSPRSYLFGFLAVTVMPAVVYAVTRFIAAPFADEAEGVDFIGGATFVGETGGAILLAWHGLRQGIQWRQPDLQPVALVALLVVGGLVVAGVAYGIGLGAEELVPWLGEPDGGHGESSAGGHHATANASPVSVPRLAPG